MKSTLSRLGIRGFKPTLRKADEKLSELCTAEGSDLLAGNRHIGFAAITGGAAPGLIGNSNWSFKSGIFSTSVEDGNPSATGAPPPGHPAFSTPCLAVTSIGTRWAGSPMPPS
jgi:hypothetical protein